MDYEEVPLINSTLNDFNDSTESYLPETIFSVICIVGTVAHIITINVFRRYISLKGSIKTYILNWLISDIIYLGISPPFYRIISCMEQLAIGLQIICIMFELAAMVQFNTILTMYVLCGNWILNEFVQGYQNRFHLIVIMVIWVIPLFGFILFSTYSCAHRFYSLVSHYTLFYSFVCLFFILLAIHVIRYVKRIKQDRVPMALWIVSAYVACWFTNWFCLLLHQFTDDYIVLYYLTVIGASLGYLTGLVNFCIFFKLDKQFRIGVLQLIRCIDADYHGSTRMVEVEDCNYNNIRSRVSMNDVYNNV